MDNLIEIEIVNLTYKSRIEVLKNRVKNLEKALWEANSRLAETTKRLMDTEDAKAEIRNAVRVFKRLIFSHDEGFHAKIHATPIMNLIH